MRALARWLIALCLTLSHAQAATVFTPPAVSTYGATVSLPINAVSASVQLPASVATYPVVEIINSGAATAYVAQGGSGVVARTSDLPIQPGRSRAFPLATGNTYIAGVMTAGVSTLRIVQWNGAPTYSGSADSPLPVITNGNGSIAATTSSVQINTLTINGSSQTLPAFLGALTVINVGNVDAAFCPNNTTSGATCTCPANGVAASNGITLPAGKGGYAFNLAGLLSTAPTVVACSGTTTLQLQW